ncbi:carbonic anhydrase [Gordonia araii]|uniref:carbonic anhydrase n=1 Tax=Gordonia araii TaxID=263909 RepID=UPI00058D46AB|nr:carbonic anhydrase [Gordonia araii]NNG97782.1 carbonic anhydrase [Gordonia araii NBRC 100433]
MSAASQRLTPAQAWANLKAGNERFVAGKPEHPNQGIDHRAVLAAGQAPNVVLFGCSDSRVAAEMIFDQGLGDMFVVRTAGHIIDSSVLGSLEFATELLHVPLIAILGHDSCGAVGSTVASLNDLTIPGGYIRDIIERVGPSILSARAKGKTRLDEFEAEHVVETGRLLMQRSQLIRQRVDSGEVAILGLTYHLADGRVALRDVLGDVDDQPAEPDEV